MSAEFIYPCCAQKLSMYRTNYTEKQYSDTTRIKYDSRKYSLF